MIGAFNEKYLGVIVKIKITFGFQLRKSQFIAQKRYKRDAQKTLH